MVDFIKKGKENIWLPYTQMKNAPEQLEVVSAKGSKITLKDGRELIDGISSWWCVAHGYNHPHIANAIGKQLRTLPHVMLAGLASEQTYKLAYNLAKVTPKGLNKVFFSDSGSTAVEVSMKMAVQFFINQKNSKKTKFISFKNSYHGDTAGAMSLADLDQGMHKKFKGYLTQNYSISLPKTQNELDEFEDFVKKHKSTTAAVIIEPLVQCAGGMKFHSAEILKQIYQITKKHNLLFIADECATGFYRTGEYFACNHANITPDIMILGKALTGGFMTLAATIATNEVYEAFLSDDLNCALMHGPTFMGNALACAAANASLELFEKIDYKEKVKEIENILKTNLESCRAHKRVKDVRVLGAIGVIETDLNWQECFDLRKEFIKERIWLRPFGGVIYAMPPLSIEKEDLEKIINSIKNIF
jgi:adenosylmethionine-8-amino-7-oxononanoate aminotransferase